MTEPIFGMRVGLVQRFETFLAVNKGFKLGVISEVTNGGERFFHADELLGSNLPPLNLRSFRTSYPIVTDERFRSEVKVAAQWELGKGVSVGPFVGLDTYVDPLRGVRVEPEVGGILTWRF